MVAMGKALYRKYRSRSLDEIVGQEHVTSLLKRALDRERIAHAYLFTGPRGTGKTSVARILAHEINQLPYSDESSHLDIIEIDAASNNGVEDIRDLREKVQLAPTTAKRKVYIIDEVHMLSKPAFNALLKTLEEPPEHVVFILATTDIEKLPETIISRTQRHTFRRATQQQLIENMQRIAKAENMAVEPDALQVIAEHSDGGYRDSVSLLDQLANTVDKNETITSTAIEQSLGLAPHKAIDAVLTYTKSGDVAGLLEQLGTLESTGVQPKIIAEQLLRAIRANAAREPQLLPLMGSLTEVSQSSLPSAKLLAVLGSFTPATPAPSTPAPVAAKGVEPKVSKPATAPTAKEPVVKEKEEPSTQPPAAKPSRQSASMELNWTKFTEAIRTASVAAYTVISKCGYIAEDGTLTIYTKTNFYHKKLDTPRVLGILQSALQNQGMSDWNITLVPTAKPPSDSQAAAVAAMMGGGEEVHIDE